MVKKGFWLLLAVLGLTVENPLMGTDSAMFRGGPRHPGLYDEVLPLKGVTPTWRLQTGAAVISSPTPADGRLFVGSGDGCLYAVKADDGQLLWKVQTGGAVHSSPAVSDNTVFFASRDGSFYALSAQDGKEKWRFATEGERWFEAKGLHFNSPKNQTIPDLWDFYLSSPLVADGRFYCGSGDGHVYALDVRTGALNWKFKTGDVVHASPALAEGVLYIGSWDTFLYALDAATGKELWRFQTASPDSNHTGIQSSALVYEGRVYFGSRDGFFYALDARTGQLIWKHDHKGTWVNASPALVDGMVVYGSSIPSLLTALDARTGEERWVQKLGGIAFSSPAAGKNGILQGTFAGSLACHDIKTGEVIWTFHSDAHQKNERNILKEDHSLDYAAIFRTPVPRAYYFENAFLDMELMLSIGSFVSSPVAANGFVYIGSTDGTVYALR